MPQSIVLIAVLLVLVATASLAALPAPDARAWLRQLIPLPKEITIERTVTVPADRVAVRRVGASNDVEANAAARLHAVLGQEAGWVPADPAFEILLGQCSLLGRLGTDHAPGAERLRDLRNSDQAYAIAPLAGNRLALTGLTERGVYYAAATLVQLLEKGKQGDQVTIPIVTVVDWPDLAERGEWGGSANRDIEWMAAQKMNLVETHISLTVDAQGRGVAHLDEATAERGRLNALKVVPIITHLDQLQGTGIYERYPELMGQGATARSTSEVAPCLSQPKFWDILADWMVCLAEQPGVSDICAWLSEMHLTCGCPDCQKVGQYALEARALVKAWRIAHERNPKVRLRVLLTQGSYATNDKVLAEIPPEVYVTYYDGGRTYDSSRDPMIYPLLEEYARQGRWLGCYPQLTASWRIVCPWPGPQFIKYRMTEFVDKGLQCLCGYATPDNRLYDFNVTAAAEWSWNARGRDEREFAAAWATRRGYADVDKVAEWAVTLGPVGWDVYGSRVPYGAFFGEAANMIKARQQPVLGQGMFRYFPTVAHLQQDLEACDHALALAEEMKAPLLIAETRVIRGYVVMLQRLYAIASLLSRPTPPTEAEREQMNQDLFALSEAGVEVSSQLRAWSELCGGAGGTRLTDTIQVTEQTVADVSKALAPLGIRNPALSLFRQKVGAWEDQDFEAQEAVQKVWEVTDRLPVPGTYHAEFAYTRGWWGLTIKRVALAAAPADAPDQRTELVADVHDGTAAYESRDNVYTLRLDAVDPAQRYYLVADIVGVRSSDKPENRRGCQGDVFLWRSLGPGERLAPLPLQPLAPEEQARYGPPGFSTAGLHVGVVQGGYGSEGVLRALQGQEGIEARAVWGVTAANLAACQVVVYPQPRVPGSVSPEMAALLGEFVRRGGGLLTTHDAVGFRGLTSPVPAVCEGGVDKVRLESWQVVADHPVTAGLPRGEALAKTYYDYISLRPGPAGAVLAASPEGAPVVVAGEAGRGRYVACGLALGLAAEGDTEASPTADEMALLLNALKWLGAGTS
ncbi:MAG: hypothetical protein HPY69_04110 [Armatimonadetes bacterium]|nr:hypothetical protein [Armatimonadota bacterium]